MSSMSPFTVALLRAVVGGVVTATIAYVTLLSADSAIDPGDRVAILPTILTFMSYIGLRFGAEGWIDTKAAGREAERIVSSDAKTTPS